MRRICTFLLCLGITAAVAGCHSHPPRQAPPRPKAPTPVVKPAPATPIENKKEELGGNTWNPQWDAIIERALPPDMLSARAGRAVRAYCPAFNRETPTNKRVFWAYFFQALAGAEAGLNPTTVVHHTDPAVDKIDTTSKRPIRQEGLLQLTYQDGTRYGCDFNWRHDRQLPLHDQARTILQPAHNLECGIRIIENQIIDQKKPLLSSTSYWSTLRPGTVSHRVFAKQMANVPSACRVPAEKKTRHERHARGHREHSAGR